MIFLIALVALQLRRALVGLALKVLDLELSSSAIAEQSIDRKGKFGQGSTSFLFIFFATVLPGGPQ